VEELSPRDSNRTRSSQKGWCWTGRAVGIVITETCGAKNGEKEATGARMEKEGFRVKVEKEEKKEATLKGEKNALSQLFENSEQLVQECA